MMSSVCISSAASHSPTPPRHCWSLLLTTVSAAFKNSSGFQLARGKAHCRVSLLRNTMHCWSAHTYIPGIPHKLLISAAFISYPLCLDKVVILLSWGCRIWGFYRCPIPCALRGCGSALRVSFEKDAKFIPRFILCVCSFKNTARSIYFHLLKIKLPVTAWIWKIVMGKVRLMYAISFPFFFVLLFLGFLLIF